MKRGRANNFRRSAPCGEGCYRRVLSVVVISSCPPHTYTCRTAHEVYLRFLQMEGGIVQSGFSNLMRVDLTAITSPYLNKNSSTDRHRQRAPPPKQAGCGTHTYQNATLSPSLWSCLYNTFVVVFLSLR